jgi:hypothetical protein
MTMIYEKQFWCGDCQQNHMIKLHSTSELNERDQVFLFFDGDYRDQLRKHTVCGSCDRNITPHTDVDIVSIKGEWREICLDCLRKV